MTDTVLKRVRTATRHQQVIDLIREAIIRGELRPGQHLAEQTLAERLDVSRIPIREALRQLELEGLVTSAPNRGCFVTQFSEHDIAEVFSLRANLEAMAIALAVPHLSRADIAALRASIERHRATLEQGRLDELTELDMQFHEYICQKANNSRMLKAWREQMSQCKMLLNWRFHAAQDSPETVARDHTMLVDCLERGDVAGAIALTYNISERVTRECIEVQRVDRERTPAA